MTDTQTLSIEERSREVMHVLKICGVPVEGVEFSNVGTSREAIRLIFSDGDGLENKEALAFQIMNGLRSLCPDLNAFGFSNNMHRWSYLIGDGKAKGFEAKVKERPLHNAVRIWAVS